jgi:hypothetical protein
MEHELEEVNYDMINRWPELLRNNPDETTRIIIKRLNGYYEQRGILTMLELIVNKRLLPNESFKLITPEEIDKKKREEEAKERKERVHISEEREKEITDMIEKQDADRYGMTIPQYHDAQRTIEKIKKECDIQDHLHGEWEPTSDYYIARECYFRGFVDGKKEGMEFILKGLGLWEEWKKAMEKNEEEEMDRRREIIRKSMEEAAEAIKKDKAKQAEHDAEEEARTKLQKG